VLATLDWDIAHLVLGGQFLTGGVYLVYEALLDAAGLVFVVALVVAMWRRYVMRPHFVLGAWDFVLWSLMVINVSGFLSWWRDCGWRSSTACRRWCPGARR
jgi:hypothetical protein